MSRLQREAVWDQMVAPLLVVLILLAGKGDERVLQGSDTTREASQFSFIALYVRRSAGICRHNGSGQLALPSSHLNR
jgi:hypothetical protein